MIKKVSKIETVSPTASAYYHIVDSKIIVGLRIDA